MNKSSKKTKINSQPLKDSFNRCIDYLRISITDKCNLKCVYCTPIGGLKHFNKSELMTYEEIVRFVRIVSKYGLRKVRVTGGEPLMRSDVACLIESIKGIGIRDVSITTNGIMLKKFARRLKKAGLDRVNISLDTMDAEKYNTITNGGDIRQVWQAIECAEKTGLTPVKINVVPIRGLNDDEIVSFASLTFNKNYHVRFIEFMPVGCNSIWRKSSSISSAEVIGRISTLGALERVRFRGRGPSRNYRLKGASGVIGIISPLTDHFCNFCNRLRLSADGKIRPCLFSNLKVDIKYPMRNGASDGEIEKLFCDAIKIKPERHLLHKSSASYRVLEAMSKIGG